MQTPTMVAIRTQFDGTTILVPAELKAAGPGEVIVLVAEKEAVGNGSSQKHSIWDVIARANGSRAAEDIDRQVKEERDSWDNR